MVLLSADMLADVNKITPHRRIVAVINAARKTMDYVIFQLKLNEVHTRQAFAKLIAKILSLNL